MVEVKISTRTFFSCATASVTIREETKTTERTVKDAITFANEGKERNEDRNERFKRDIKVKDYIG